MSAVNLNPELQGELDQYLQYMDTVYQIKEFENDSGYYYDELQKLTTKAEKQQHISVIKQLRKTTEARKVGFVSLSTNGAPHVNFNIKVVGGGSDPKKLEKSYHFIYDIPPVLLAAMRAKNALVAHPVLQTLCRMVCVEMIKDGWTCPCGKKAETFRLHPVSHISDKKPRVENIDPPCIALCGKDSCATSKSAGVVIDGAGSGSVADGQPIAGVVPLEEGTPTEGTNTDVSTSLSCAMCKIDAQSLAKSGAPALKSCAACKKTWYCTVECQKVHWKQGHKKECKKQAA